MKIISTFCWHSVALSVQNSIQLHAIEGTLTQHSLYSSTDVVRGGGNVRNAIFSCVLFDFAK